MELRVVKPGATSRRLLDRSGSFQVLSELPVEQGAKLWSTPLGLAQFPDPERPDGWLEVKATFFDGRMFGFVERVSPDPTDPEEDASDPIVGRFPVVHED